MLLPMDFDAKFRLITLAVKKKNEEIMLRVHEWFYMGQGQEETLGKFLLI